MNIFPLSLLVLIEIQYHALSYKCYQCLSEFNSSCTSKEPKEEFRKYLAACEQTTDTNEPCCRTLWKTAHFTLRKKNSLVRECCGPTQRPVGGCYRTEYATLAYEFNCECHYEGCNAATSPVPTSTLQPMTTAFLNLVLFLPIYS